MTENIEQLELILDSNLTDWGAPILAAVCDHCDWTFLIHKNNLNAICPHCFQSRLEPMQGDISALTHLGPPELVLLPSVPSTQLEQQILEFARGIPFSPGDLGAVNLQSRLKTIFLPVWLVDIKAKANWEAEMGFNYQVVSHQERFEQNRGNWQTQQVEERRVRWDLRLGTLDRVYQNVAAPALEEDGQIRKSIGNFNFQASQAYSAQIMENGMVCLPNRSKQDAWQDVFPTLQSKAADECRRASAADHIRQFQWSPAFQEHHWTLLLQPAITTYYLDDDQKVQPVMINGQSGRISGVRRASMKKAKQVSGFILLAALILFVVSLSSLVLAPLLPMLVAISAIGVAVSFAIGLAALLPILIVWMFNRSSG